ncbi:hypothetical protein AB0G83_05250 [Streptomyces klenkii]|nr:hypothetical protein [Streptomyces klenkii]
MTDRTDTVSSGEGRGAQILMLLILTALLMTPCLWVWSLALNEYRQSSSWGWEINHRNKVQFEAVSGFVFGVPSAGVFLGWVVAGFRGKHLSTGAATGGCLGALGLVVCGVVGFFWMLSHATIDF